ncbi:MAG: 50S ribosomal protein L11 methyltransferase [Cyanobacteria bacterium P01_D01_bin.123]
MASAWWELQLDLDPDAEDIAFWRLREFGCKGTVSQLENERLRVRAYAPQEQFSPTDLETLASQLVADTAAVSLPSPVLRWTHLDSEDWANTWKEHWHPVFIGDRFVICPVWLDVPPHGDRHVLLLDPGVAFGTGEHATTQMCLESLAEIFATDAPPITVADIGCGSGILSLGAAKLGAHRVYAVDIEPQAVQVTKANCDRNQLTETISVCLGSIEAIPTPADGIVCNILAEVIIPLAPHFAAIARADSWIVLSGLIQSQIEAVTEAMTAAGWTMISQRTRGEWACLKLRRS